MADQQLASIEAEQSVIGGVLIAPVDFADIAAVVSASDFTTELHRKIFGAMVEMDAAKQPIDILTVAEWLEAKGDLHDGEWAYIGASVRDTPSAANVLSYARIVRDRARRRELVQLGTELQGWAFRDGDAEKALLKLRSALERFDSGKQANGLVPLQSILSDCISIIDKRFEGVGPKGVNTGLLDLDGLLHGLQSGKLYVIAGRPAMGKSLLGLQFAERMSSGEGKTTAFFTAEMPNSEQVERLLASVGRISLDSIQTGKLSESDWAQLASASAMLSSAKLWFDETPSPRLLDILSKARALHRKHGPIGMVVVDHAGLVEVDGDNRAQQQSEVGRKLKSLAKELDCPVIALVQLNRKLEERADKRPILSDGKDSGGWEESADVFAGIYRDEVYNPDSIDKGCAELLIRKHRGGKLGTIPLRFNGDHAKFESLSGGLPSWNQPAIIPMRKRGFDL
jgi:replicative DNA helicase